VLELGIKFLLSYFLGSVMGAMTVGRLKGGVDIRTMGSGNAGGTNALRTQGALFALGVVVIDIGKGAVAAGIIPGLDLPGIGIDPEVSRAWLQVVCAAGAVVGHVWPMWHSFRGGKGGATLIGTLLVLEPQLVLPVLLVFAISAATTGYVGLSTMSAAVAAPAYVAITRLPHDQPLFFYCVAMAMLIIYCHRANIGRMLEGTEPKSARLMLLRKDRHTSDHG
jgi:acyl phosphate:glycerol-3-phosphate acyltransferase